MSPHRFRSRHSLALALICAICTGVLLVPPLVQFADLLARARWEETNPRRQGIDFVSDRFAAWRRLDWGSAAYLQRYGRKNKLPANVVFLPIDSNSTTLRDVSPDEVEASPALRLISQTGWPYSREIYPMILDRLFQAGAKVVAFDLRFTDPRDADPAWRAALEKYRDRVVIGTNLVSGEREIVTDAEGNEIEKPGVKPMLEMPARTLIPSGDAGDSRLGFVNFRPEEEDGLVRYAFFRTTLMEYFGKPALPPEIWSLAAQTARKAGYEALIPAAHRSWMIRFVDQHGLRPLSLHDIFSERVWARPPFNGGAYFKDKIVVIGPYGNWTKDELPTPLDDNTLGPQIHLSALAAILNHDFLNESTLLVDVGIILLAGLAAWLLSTTIRDPIRRSLALLAVAALYVGGAFALYNQAGYVVKLLSPSLTLLASGGVALTWERLAEQKERLRVRRTLERYVSRDVVKEVLDNPQSFLHALEGERRPISVLFSDVRGFTTLTESMEASLLVRQLNEYFTEMVRIVFKHQGTVEKFIGDAVMASWGGIVVRSETECACSAVAAALEMLRELERLNAGWKLRGLPELKIGVGVNHGEAICGHLGSEEKLEFSVMGDAVNFASRVEGATKEYHQELLIGERVARLVRDCVTVRTVDLLQVKGKTAPVEVFTATDEPAPAWLPQWEEGMRLYRARDFAGAQRVFAAVRQAAPEDWLAGEYLRRGEELTAHPPGPEWNGVHIMHTK